jgi:hypothetical protein
VTFFYIALIIAIVFLIWRRLARRDSAPVAMRDPAFDRTEGHPDAGRAMDMLVKGEWRALTSLYWKLEPSDRYHLVQGLGELAAIEPITWPDDADSALLTINGGICLAQAGKARGTGPGAGVKRAAAQHMADSLMEARKLLDRAASINPHDSTNFALQIRVAMALGGDRVELNRLLGKIDASEEHNIFAAANHLQFVSPKWHGSVEEMWETANAYASNPHNAAWLAIAARAHIEEWLYSMAFDPSVRQAYIAKLQDDGFKDHIRSLDRLFWNRAEEGEMSRAEATFAHNNMAFLLQMVRADEKIAPHLERIGANVSILPWGYLPDGAEKPTRLLSELRRKAGLPALGGA